MEVGWVPIVGQVGMMIGVTGTGWVNLVGLDILLLCLGLRVGGIGRARAFREGIGGGGWLVGHDKRY